MLAVTALTACARGEERAGRAASVASVTAAPGAVTGPGRSATASGAPVLPAASSVGAAGSAIAPPAPGERLVWEAPRSWRAYVAPSNDAMKAHFVALEGPPRKGVTARVDVYVLEQRNVNGPNPEARVAAAAEQEAAPFARVDSRRVDSLDVAGTKVTLVEIRGTMKEITQMPPFGKKLEVKERPGRMQITALVPAGGPPYRVAMFGPSELVERVKPDFMRFVESLRVTR